MLSRQVNARVGAQQQTIMAGHQRGRVPATELIIDPRERPTVGELQPRGNPRTVAPIRAPTWTARDPGTTGHDEWPVPSRRMLALPSHDVAHTSS